MGLGLGTRFLVTPRLYTIAPWILMCSSLGAIRATKVTFWVWVPNAGTVFGKRLIGLQGLVWSC